MHKLLKIAGTTALVALVADIAVTAWVNYNYAVDAQKDLEKLIANAEESFTIMHGQNVLIAKQNKYITRLENKLIETPIKTEPAPRVTPEVKHFPVGDGTWIDGDGKPVLHNRTVVVTSPRGRTYHAFVRDIDASGGRVTLDFPVKTENTQYIRLPLHDIHMNRTQWSNAGWQLAEDDLLRLQRFYARMLRHWGGTPQGQIKISE